MPLSSPAVGELPLLPPGAELPATSPLAHEPPRVAQRPRPSQGHGQSFLPRQSRVSETPLSLAGASPRLLQRPSSAWRPARSEWTGRRADARGGCRRSRRDQPLGNPPHPRCASAADARPLGALRSSPAVPRRKPAFQLRASASPSLSEPELALASPATSWCLELTGRFGALAAHHRSRLQRAGNSHATSAQTLSPAQIRRGTSGASLRGAQVQSCSGFGGLRSCPGKGQRCPWLGRGKVGKSITDGPPWPESSLA